VTLKEARHEARLAREPAELSLGAFHAGAGRALTPDDVTTPATAQTERVLHTIGAPLELPTRNRERGAQQQSVSRSQSASPCRLDGLRSPATHSGGGAPMHTESALPAHRGALAPTPFCSCSP
jgi:hypothetical protein